LNMAKAQIYCTLDELINDLKLTGDESGLFDRIKQASAHLERLFRNWIPITESRYFLGNGGDLLKVDPILAATAITVDGEAITDYELQNPNSQNALWTNGPYTRIKYLSGAWSATDDIPDGYGNIVTGRWGIWEETEDKGITVTQLISDTDLDVSNGSLACIGMVLKIEDEQELVTSLGAGTSLTSKLNGAIDEEDDEITIDNGAEVLEGEVIQCGVEDIHIRKINGNVLGVDRGWNTTKRASHIDDSALKVYRTFNVTRGVNGTTAAAHTTKELYRMIVHAEVNWLCRQIAGLMRMKAASNFAGKAGNTELGETYYYNEFPRQIEDIRRNYRIY